MSSDDAYDALLDHVNRHRGIDFTSYKSSTLRRRLAKRMQEVGAETHAEYLDRLQASPDEFEPLLQTLFINVTAFFRDPEAWRVIEEDVVPLLLEGAEADVLRVWCAGVASGEEAYSVAILMAEATGLDELSERVKIFATDLDDDALAQARAATYPGKAVEDVRPELLERYFEAPVRGKVVVRPEIRRAVIFGRHDLLADAPISRLDLLVCRNTLMYFNREAQGRILSRFHFAMAPSGYLFLGKAEMLLTRRDLFSPVEGKARLFRKVSHLSLRDRLAILSQTGPDEEQTDLLGEVQLRDLAFDTSPVPEILVDTRGVLVLANQAARGLFHIATRDVGRPFHEIDLSFRPVELRGPIERARTSAETVEIRDVEWRDAGGTDRTLEVRVVPLLEHGAMVAVKVAFMDVTRHRELASALSQSKRELEVAYEELQSTNEELETTNEELQSTVEELETTNEELQSTNEELETMNEELQSTNVEIETVNDELRERTEELGRVNRYVGSILNSVQQPVVVLDRDLHVRTWNEPAAELWGLRAEDVEGKAFLGLDMGLPAHELRDTMRACISGELPTATATLNGHDRRGKPMDHHVRCMPLNDEATGEVMGVVLMVDGRRGEG